MGSLQGPGNPPAGPVPRDLHLRGVSLLLLFAISPMQTPAVSQTPSGSELAAVGARGTEQLSGLITLLSSPEICNPIFEYFFFFAENLNSWLPGLAALPLFQSTNHFFSARLLNATHGTSGTPSDFPCIKTHKIVPDRKNTKTLFFMSEKVEQVSGRIPDGALPFDSDGFFSILL